MQIRIQYIVCPKKTERYAQNHHRHFLFYTIPSRIYIDIKITNLKTFINFVIKFVHKSFHGNTVVTII